MPAFQIRGRYRADDGNPSGYLLADLLEVPFPSRHAADLDIFLRGPGYGRFGVRGVDQVYRRHGEEAVAGVGGCAGGGADPSFGAVDPCAGYIQVFACITLY